MSSMEEIMNKLKEISGFKAVGVFTAQGELIGQIAGVGIQLDEFGAIANDVLLKSQQATEIMGVGRGNLVHIGAPKAHVLARCLNENTDFSANEPGRAHIHMIMVLEPDANIGLAKLKLEKVEQELAPLLR